MNFAEKVIAFNKQLKYTGFLPSGFQVLNPYFDNPETLSVMTLFYQKFYNDSSERKFIIGINPSRHGAGVTGVPFTDTKRLRDACGINMVSVHTHEVSSVFLYDMIEDYGGPASFYTNFYINSPFPLAIVKPTQGNAFVNANYYDEPQLFAAVKDFMIESLRNHIQMGLNTREVYVLGKKNAMFIEKLNKQAKLFKSMKVLEHPRFIQQYKSKEKSLYIDKYLRVLGGFDDDK
jgi:hypothetical protein